MLGTLRLLLATAVAFSHMGLTPNFHFGAMSVIVFYLIAGYVMTHSWRTNFAARLSNAGSFYLDRLFRIYPLYLVSLVLIYLFVALTGYGRLYLDPRSMFVNLTVFLLNLHPTIMNPAAWSLGTEAQFYLLLPFLACFPASRYLLLPASYAIFAAASFGLIPAMEWGYKYLPGTLFFFILGSFIYDFGSDRRARLVVLATLAGFTLHLAILACFPRLIDQPYAFEELCGGLLGSICLLLLGRSKPAYPKLDDTLGKLSYPLFLGHVCVLYGFDYLRTVSMFQPALRGAVALQVLCAVVLCVPLMFLDDLFQKTRKRLQLGLVAKSAAYRYTSALSPSAFSTDPRK